MPQRRSFHRVIERTVDWKAFAWRSLCFIGVVQFLAPCTPFLEIIQAQTPTPQAQSSIGAKEPEHNESPAASPSPSKDRPIPLPKIADRAEELDQLLREIGKQLMPAAGLQEFGKKTADQEIKIRRRALQTRDLLVGTPTPLELEDEQRYWRARNREYQDERRLLTARVSKLEMDIETLGAQQPEWAATWNHIRELPGIESVVERTKQQLDKIQATKSEAQEQLKVILKLQNEVAQQEQQISDILFRVREAYEGQYSRLFEPDSPAFWRDRELSQPEQSVGPALRGSFDRLLTTAKEFGRAHKLALPILAGCYLLALLFIFRIRRYVASGAGPGVPAGAAHMLSRPFSVALVLTLIGSGKFVASAPVGIAFLFHMLYLMPVLRILARLTQPRLRIFLYVLAALYGFEGMYLLIQLPPVFIRRALYVLLVVTALVSIGWLARPSKMLQVTMERRRRRVLVIGIQSCLLLLAASLIGNIVGFVSLSQVLGMTALIGPFLALALYCGTQVLAMILGILLRTHWARALPELRLDTLERWGSRLLGVAGLALWLQIMLQVLTLRDRIVETAFQILNYPIGVDKIHFALGDALGVPFILVGGYFFAKALTFLLKTLLLPRLPLQRGLPDAISTVTYYLLLVLVALAALSGAGIELNKFTVLTGALGVGLGFGLQNIVNNFVSGLILLFERPIRVGDTVDVGGLVGVVRRIGARSSTVVTFQGAEVIVPNSNLLQNQVINWTLSSQWRRVDVPVRVAYGTDPERVIKLLVRVAESNPGVLLARPPMAFFLGFGESSLNFELRFWSAWQDTWFQLQSDVTVEVAKALREANIEIPFPQRDLHLRSGDSHVAQALRTASIVDLPERNPAR